MSTGLKILDLFREVDIEELKSLPLRLRADENEFSASNALFSGVAAAAAYEQGQGDGCSWPEAIFGAEGMGFTGIKTFPKNWKGTEGYVMESEEAFIVVFCGTDSFIDWLQNLDIDMVKKDGVYVHEGFWECLDVVWEWVSARLRQSGKGKPVWLCGHSLGGALAVLAAFRALKLKKIDIQGAYTFGQPFVGEALFKGALSRLEGRIYRFVNSRDPVPLMPVKGRMRIPFKERRRVRIHGKRWKRPSRKAVSFEHVGELFWFDDDGVLKTGENRPNSRKRRFSG